MHLITSLSVIVGFVSCAQADILTSEQRWCLPGWLSLNTTCIFISAGPSESSLDRSDYYWNNALKACNKRGSGLLIPRDNETLQELLVLHEKMHIHRPLYLGSREAFNVQWKWLGGGAVTPALWGPGQPNTEYGRCGVIENFERRYQTWCGWWLSSRRCNFRRGFICEAKPVNNSCEPEFALVEDRCYKIHLYYRLSWDDARLECLSKQSYLAEIDTKEKLKGLSDLLRSKKPSVTTLQVGFVMDIQSWLWADGTPIDGSLWALDYPMVQNAETCAAFNGHDPAVVNLNCDEYYGYVCQTPEANVAYASLTYNSSVATGSNSSFAVNNNLTNCFFSKKEVNPWLRIELDREFFVYKVRIENNKNVSNNWPLHVTVGSRERENVIMESVCKEIKHDTDVEYQCIPPVKGRFVQVKGPNFNSTLALCYVAVLAFDSVAETKGILREVWDTDTDKWTIFSLKKWNVFETWRDYWNIIQIMDAPFNFGNYYAQRLSAFLKIVQTGDYLFYMNCDQSCELWIQVIDDLTVYGDNSMAADPESAQQMLLKLGDSDYTDRHEWDRYPEKQQSTPLFLSRCRFYSIEVLMKETVSYDHLSVGIKFPNGQYQKPMKAEYLYWMKTGERTLKFSNLRFEPKGNFTAEVGSTISISASYIYCCHGIFCPGCDMKLSLNVFNNFYTINDSFPMNCQDTVFNITLQADIKPGHYPIQVNYSFVDDSAEEMAKFLEIGHISVTAAVLEESRFSNGLSSWTSKGNEGAQWRTGGVHQGAFLVGVNKASLESAVLPWKESYNTGFTCLHFKYMLPQKADPRASSSLRVYVVSNNNRDLMWELTGFHGNKSSEAQISWKTKENTVVVFEGEAINNSTSSVVIKYVKIVTNPCDFSPIFANPGYRCTREEFQCNNLKCIRSILKCDGVFDCLDGSDESDCKCLQSQFTCLSGECLSVERLRDGEKDCQDGEDEKQSPGDGQHVQQFQCFDGTFISWSQTCKSDGCIDNTHLPSICGVNGCPLNNLPCQNQESKTVKEVTCRIPFQGHCSFQNGLCALRNPVHEEIQWTIGKGSLQSSNPFDHTMLSKEGYYLYVKGANRQTSGKAILRSGWFSLKWPICLQFWYHVDGTLNVFIVTNSSETNVWTQQGSSTDHWTFAQTTLNGSQDFMFVVEGLIKKGHSSDMAVDDITVVDGSCSKIVEQASADCSFDYGLCGWTGEEDWKLAPATSPERGRFLYFKNTNDYYENKSLATKTLQPSDGSQCVRFWYFIGEEEVVLYEYDIHKLTVRALDPENDNVTTLWVAPYRTDRWVYVQLPLNKSSRAYKLQFEGQLGTDDAMTIALDDVSFSKETCEPIPNDGMKNTCTWVTVYSKCCRFPFVYKNKEYYSCTDDEDEELWCIFGDGDYSYGGCDDHCLWTTETGQCCSFPFDYGNQTYSSCIITPDRPRPWCDTLYVHGDPENWDYCKDYCDLGRELCSWDLSDGDGLWKSVGREVHKSLNNLTFSFDNKDTSDKDINDFQDFELRLPTASRGNITLHKAIREDMTAMTACVWLQTNGSTVQIEYVTPLGCRRSTAIEILVRQAVQITVLGNKREIRAAMADGNWHHVCTSWFSLGGLVKIYIDGHKKWSARVESASHLSIRGGGNLTVGCPGGKSTSDKILAHISELNIWNHVIDEEEIWRMSVGCARRDGNARSWASMLSGVQGSVQVNHDTSSCQDQAGDRLLSVSNSNSNLTKFARLRSPWYNRSAEGYGRCLKFRYMLYGAGKKTLKVYQRDDLFPIDKPIWQDETTGGTLWQYGQVSVSAVTRHQLLILGSLHHNSGYIAIGGLYLTQGYCTIEPSRAAKGCSEHLTDKTGLILSPNYPGYYGNNARCEWHVTAPMGHVVRLEFLYFRLENQSRCLNDYVEVFDGVSSSSPSLGKFCGHIYTAILQSSSTDMLVVFKSNDNIMRTGFKARYHAREAKYKECKTKQDCPPGCKCHIIQGTPTQYVLEGSGDLETVPNNISQLTTAILLGGNRISQLRNEDFLLQSSLLYIDLSYNKIFQLEKKTFQGSKSLETLRLNNNFLKELDPDVFSGLTKLQTLDLSDNLFTDVPDDVLDDLSNLRILSLRSNKIRQIKINTFQKTRLLTHLFLQHNAISTIDENSFIFLSRLQYLHLNNNKLKKLNKAVFSGLVSLETLLLKENSIVENGVATDTFEGLGKLKKLSLDSFILCCYAKKATEKLVCDSPQNEFSSCDDMMKSPAVRVCLWILGLLALVGNLSVIIWRLVHREDSKVQSFLLTNLAVSDLLMGVYLIIIAVQDTRWQGEYFKHDIEWRSGLLCQLTGALSMLSSEVSVMLLTIITTDRLICIVFNLRVQRLTLKACYIICFTAWALGLVMSFLPMSGLSYFNDAEEGSRFYGRSAVCLALQLSSDRPPGWEYSVSIFIGLNLLSFIFISFAYAAIFYSALKSSSSIRSTNVKRESALAKRVAFIILTDFCCWMPVIIVGILSLTGSFHDPEKQAYVWMAVFVLPVNSSVNPILYTIATPQVQKWICMWSSKETKQGRRQNERVPRQLQGKTPTTSSNECTTKETARDSSSDPNRMCQNDNLQSTSTKSAVSLETCLSWDESTENNDVTEYDTRF